MMRFFPMLLALALAGCPDSKPALKDAPAAACTTQGEKCSLAPGVLGVCNDVPCRSGQTPPCLGCVSQH